MNANPKSISLSYDDVALILEEHLNRCVLRNPHHVTRVDPWDWDGTDEHQFTISLEPMPAAESVTNPGVDQVLPAIAVPVLARINGANKNGGGKAPDKKEVTAEPSPDGRKRRAISREQRERIVDLVNRGAKRRDIAAAVDLTESRLYEVIAELRAAGQLPQRAEPAVA